MRKAILASSLIALILPVAAYAATAQELAAQIEALLKQVSALQQQVGAGATPGGTGNGVPTAGAVNTSGIQCPLISRNLKKGMSGTDVTRLQQFLALDPSIYPEKSVTGYYGALTEAAVKRFQCKNKIVCDGTPESTGYGVTGPRTAALLALQCPDIIGGGGNSNIASGFFRVTPTSGPVPLMVQVEAILNTVKSCSGVTFEVYYGDGSAPANITVPSGYCNELRQVLSHTFTANGAYTISLRSGIHQNSVTVNVTGTATPPPSASIFNASPISGPAPLNVLFTGTRNVGNSCSAGSYTIDFGDGTSTQIPDTGCSASSFSFSHSYANTGNYVARFYRNNDQGETRSISIAVGGSSGGAFTITPGTDGDPMKSTAQFDLVSSCARYDLDWGDGSSHATQSEGSCAAGTTSKNLPHTYQNAGTYTLTLKRGANLDSTATISLVIVN